MHAKVHKDDRGHLFELFRVCEWAPRMAYTVLTHPGYGRDVYAWHKHNRKSEVFVCLYGDILVATSLDGVEVDVHELSSGDGIFISVSPGELHSVINVSAKDAVLAVFCDDYYDPADELREPMDSWEWCLWANKRK